MITLDFIARYRFFREHAGYVVGRRALGAYRLAKAEERAEREGLACVFEDENRPWDGECPAPRYVLQADVPRLRQSLGMIGVDSLQDPYLRVVAADLYLEGFDAQVIRGRAGVQCDGRAA